MQIDHVHFYTRDAQQQQAWLIQKWGWAAVGSTLVNDLTHDPTVNDATPAVQAGAIRFEVSAPRSSACPVAQYLSRHPAGMADLAFRVAKIEPILQQATKLAAKILQPLHWRSDASGSYRAACIQGWGDLQHTLVERGSPAAPNALPNAASWLGIDHVVLNVERGDLGRALSWYEQMFGFQRCQNFAIQTAYSALCSQVLRHPGGLQIPINEPASASSQIQEFLDWNRGSGIQHIALRVSGILPLMARLRQHGVAFLPIPDSYYQRLRQRSNLALTPSEQQAIAEQEVLVDWRPDYPEALLLQAFTLPIFEQPTFFFELIERRTCRSSQQLAEGFGEGNFQALFEAIEREQIKRGSLSC